MKKTFYLQNLAALVVCLVCALGASAYDFASGGIYYSITTYSDGSSVATVENNGSTNTYSGMVTIPATVEYNGKTCAVVSIGYRAFKGSTGLTAVNLPEGIAYFSNEAFAGCTNLTSITIPASIVTIYNNVFTGCTALRSVTCLRTTPNSTYTNNFDQSTYTNATLYVPDGSLSRYQSTAPWSSFARIKGINAALNEALGVTGGTIAFSSSGNYPWTVVNEGSRTYARSGNMGVHSSTSTMTATINSPVGGRLSFYYKAWGEGTSTLYDKSVFVIDGVAHFTYGAYDNDWTQYIADLTPGTHTLTWTYSKDSSVNPTGDYFAVDDVTFTEGLIINEDNFPDENFRSYLLSEYPSGLITPTQLANRITLSLSYRSISNIQGIGYFTELETLYCSYNSVTSVDVSANTKLTKLECTHNNQLTSINVTNCANLTYIDCSHNSYDVNLTTIQGLRTCTALEDFYGDHCKLTSLDLSQCAALKRVLVGNNQLTTLTLGNHPSLFAIDCQENQLSSLNVSGCPSLVYFWCYRNRLTSLDLSPCLANLYQLICYENQISHLDVANHTRLQDLDCDSNNLTSLDVSGCSNLLNLYCGDNQMTSLDVANLPTLQNLACYSNNLTSLDVSGCSSLQVLYCGDNQMTSLNVSNCPALREMNIVYNKLKGGKMDQIVAQLPTCGDDAHGSLYAIVEEEYVEEGFSEGNVMTVSQVNQANAKNWDVYHWIEYDYVPYAGSTGMPGDVNDDGNVNIMDVTALIDYLLTGDASGVNQGNADVNGDGSVNITDVTALIDMLLSGSYKMTKPATVSSGSASLRSLVLDKELVLEKPRRARQ